MVKHRQLARKGRLTMICSMEVCVFILETNKSTDANPHNLTRLLNNDGKSCHSLSYTNLARDTVSALVLRAPGKCEHVR